MQDDIDSIQTISIDRPSTKECDEYLIGKEPAESSNYGPPLSAEHRAISYGTMSRGCTKSLRRV